MTREEAKQGVVTVGRMGFGYRRARAAIAWNLNALLKPQLRRSKWFRRWSGERSLRRRYKALFNTDLNLKAPNTFSEKLFNRMIMLNRNGDANFTRLTDKYLVRGYVREKVGDAHLKNLLWQGTSPLAIPFDRLPRRYVVKTNHGAGYNIIVDGEVDRQKIIETLRAWLRENFYWNFYEYQYFDIFPRILVEEFVDDGERDGAINYRFWCFGGVPEVINVSDHQHRIHQFYDTSWNKSDLHFRKASAIKEIPKPKNFDRMLVVAAELSKDIDFVCVDLNNAKGQIFFGELTFTTRAGNIQFKPDPWDKLLAQKWWI